VDAHGTGAGLVDAGDIGRVGQQVITSRQRCRRIVETGGRIAGVCWTLGSGGGGSYV
jgi:hypothetical protein